MRDNGLAIAVAALAAATAGCNASGPPTPEVSSAPTAPTVDRVATEPRTAAVPAPIDERQRPPSLPEKAVSNAAVPTYNPGAVVASARWSGMLEKIGSCLVVRAGGDAAVPIFPHGRALWNAASETLAFDGKTYGLGDRIDLVGGFSSTDPKARPAIRGLSSDCPTERIWLAG